MKLSEHDEAQNFSAYPHRMLYPSFSLLSLNLRKIYNISMFIWNYISLFFLTGSLLFNFSKTAADTVSFKISNKTDIKQIYRGDLKNCFNFTTGDDWYAVTLAQELDLERFYRIWVSVILYYLSIKEGFKTNPKML